MPDFQEKEDSLLENPTGTPSAETPEAAPAVETPAVADSQVKVAEDPQITPKPEEKSSEQIAADRAYFQAQYQQEVEERKKVQSIADEALAKLAQFRPPEEPAPVVQTQTTKPVVQAPQFSDEELTEALKDNPLLGFQAISDHMQKAVAAQVVDILDKRDQQRQMEFEQREANKTLNEFAQKSGVTAQDVAKVHEQFKALGIKGSPSAMAALTIQQLNYQLATRNVAERAAKAAADAAEKAKAQALTVQPGVGGAGASPTEQPPKNIEDVIAAKFSKPKARTAEEALLSGKL